jgi:uncharacterized protein (TIGR02266 family)
MSGEQQSAEQRSDPRYLARIAIFNGPFQKELVTDYTVNVSSGGVFIEKEKVFPVDTLLMVKFKLPHMDNVITCQARVAWTNEPALPKKPSLPTGMGIQFMDLSLDDLHAIRQFLDKGDLIPTW